LTNIFTDACKNALLDSAVSGSLTTGGTSPHLSLHTGFPPAGGNEVTGGSYARQPFTWSAASGGSKAIAAAETFSVPATTVRAVAVYDALTAGTQKVWLPAGSSARIAISVDAAGVTNNDIFSEAHGLVSTNSVIFWDTYNAGLPAGLVEDTEYFVIATGITADTFRVSATLGGAAIDLTDEGVGDCQKFVPEVFAAPGTYEVSTYTVSLPG
jgi:hypothetical protein